MSNKHIFNKNILRQYDIRGRYGDDLDEKDAYFVGYSLAVYIRSHNIYGKICVGYDGRKSSFSLKKSLLNGILDAGVEVVEIGLVPTPVLYYACHTIKDAPSGVMVTASHNKKEYNGFKIIIDKKPFFGDSLKILANIASSGTAKPYAIRGKSTYLYIDDQYVIKVTDPKVHFSSRSEYADLKIAWDVCNAVASNVLKKIIKKLPGTHVIINDVIDGNFPAHPPDPTMEENLTQLKSVIHNESCDFGIALDGDADRLVFINNDGRVFFGDELLTFFARDFLKRYPKATIISDVKVSKSVLDEIKRLGGKTIIWKTGHSHIKSKMLKENIMLAGEVSGHIFLWENYYCYDDALFAACKLIWLYLDKNNGDYLNDLPKSFVSNEIRIRYKQNKNHNIIYKLKNVLNSAYIDYCDLDGVRVENKRGWWLLRPSNTEDALVIRLEGYSRNDFNFIIKNLISILKKIGLPKVLYYKLLTAQR
jgi:phosphomannomutase